MSGMQDKFHSDVEKSHRAAKRHRKVVDTLKKHTRENPELFAMRIVEVVPESLKRTRSEVLRELGLDLADEEAVRSYKVYSVAEWQVISRLATSYQIYKAFLRLVMRYYRDPNLTGVRSALAVCEAFIEAAERHLYTVALDFDELRKNLPEESFPNEELAKVLSGIIATRTSLHSNPPLRAAIDERREYSRDKSAKRERFEQLLKDLPAHVLEVWQEAAHPLGSLDEMRTEAARRLGKRDSKPPLEVELAAFVDREKLLKQAKAAGLPPREYELFKLRVVENPGMSLREAAQRMGIAEGTAKSLWSRIKRTLLTA
jgi:DNA-directed RNA polymerase specialized sigma24 family protein